MPKLVDIAGCRFERLTALTYDAGKRLWNCLCDCGNRISATSSNLRYGRTRSCGCFRKEELSKRSTHHEAHRTPEWVAWCAMRQRCRDPKRKDWKNYGGRGIKVCERWMTYETFLADMRRRPSPKHSLDRMNNDGDYEPGNCRWATKAQQIASRRQIGPFWDPEKRRAAGDKGRQTRTRHARR